MERVKFLVLAPDLRRLQMKGLRTEADVTTMTIRFTDVGRTQGSRGCDPRLRAGLIGRFQRRRRQLRITGWR
jgi:hypothetical protein